MQAHTIRLTQSQTQLLLAMALSDSPTETKAVAHRSARTLASAKMLVQLGYIVMDPIGASVTELGFMELKTNGFLNDAGESTEFGQKYYQQAVDSLNEFHLIRELLLHE